MHRFYKQQPDLNIASPRVREEIRKIGGFWLEIGLSGFRVDAVPFLLETDGIAHSMELPDRRRFQLIAFHPEPPVPCADTLGRDAEVIAAAGLVREKPLPAILTGDLNPVLRWPLDHLFHDGVFRLEELRGLPDIRSNHFPIFFVLGLAQTEEAGESPDPPDDDDLAEEHQVVREAAEPDRKPISTDWEE